MADETQATAPVAVAEPAAPQAPDSQQAAPATEPPADDPYAKVADLDVDELIRRNPRLQGKIGDLAARQARESVQREMARIDEQRRAEEAERQERQHREELKRLAAEDPDKLAERVQADLTQQEWTEREQRRFDAMKREMGANLQAELDKVYHRPIVREIWEKADDATRQRLDWRAYPSFAEFAEAVADVVGDYRSEQRAEKLAKERVEAALRDAKVADIHADGATTPDLGVGGIAGGQHRWTRSELSAMDMPTYRKHREEILRQEREGLIVEDRR